MIAKVVPRRTAQDWKHQRLLHWLARLVNHAAASVGDVVMGAGTMIDGVLAAAAGTTFERAELVDETLVVEKVDPAGHEQG
jgi:hypothetical protein